VLIEGLESNAVGAARVSSLVKELLGPFRVIPVVLLDLFGPLFIREAIPDKPYPLTPRRS